MTDANVPAYSLAERDRRWNLTRNLLEKQGLDALIVYGEHDDAGPAPYTYDNWFTNDKPGSTVVFPRTGKPLILMMLPGVIVEHVKAGNRGEETWFAAEDIRIGRGAATLNTALKDLGLTKSSIGVLGLEPYLPIHPEGVIPFQLWSKVVSENPNVSFKSLGSKFARMIMVLSDEQVAVLRRAASIGDSIVHAMVEATGVGVAENKIFQAGMSAAYAQGTAIPRIHFSSGPEAINWGSPRWTYSAQAPPRVLQTGDVLSGEIFSNFGTIATQQQITVAVGAVHKDVERAAMVARACYEAGLKALRPKATFEDVAQAMRRPVEEAGGWSKGPQVHSLNPILNICTAKIDLRRVGADEKYPCLWMLPTLEADMVLEPGMSFALEPCCIFGSHGVTIGGTVVVGQDAPIELNPYSAQLLRVS